MKIYKNAKGEIKFYATYQSAWRAAVRLNQKDSNASWLFEQNGAIGNGWFLFQENDDEYFAKVGA